MAEDGQRGLHIQEIRIKSNKPVKSLNNFLPLTDDFLLSEDVVLQKNQHSHSKFRPQRLILHSSKLTLSLIKI